MRKEGKFLGFFIGQERCGEARFAKIANTPALTKTEPVCYAAEDHIPMISVSTELGLSTWTYHALEGGGGSATTAATCRPYSFSFWSENLKSREDGHVCWLRKFPPKTADSLSPVGDLLSMNFPHFV